MYVFENNINIFTKGEHICSREFDIDIEICMYLKIIDSEIHIV